jgi:hypothetical protein
MRALKTVALWGLWVELLPLRVLERWPIKLAALSGRVSVRDLHLLLGLLQWSPVQWLGVS